MPGEAPFAADGSRCQDEADLEYRVTWRTVGHSSPASRTFDSRSSAASFAERLADADDVDEVRFELRHVGPWAPAT